LSLSFVAVDNALNKIANNTAAGFDNICIEHFKLAHPSVISILKAIFNIFISLGEVPLDFGRGIVTPIPKFKGRKSQVSAEDFRGITLTPIASKIFEHCLIIFLSNLQSSSRQLGFKKNVGCSHAINTLKNTALYFNKRGNTVNLCFIDIKKAFDKTNFWGILTLLQKFKINPSVICILEYWFKVGSARVNWNGCLSDPVYLSAGVRQGSILSPLLFAAYIDVVLSSLEASKLGCFINGQCLNSLLYADDLLLMSISLTDLIKLINMCKSALDSLDLQINFEKSSCLRIGSRFGNVCNPISVNECVIPWVKEAKYLGVNVLSRSHFLCDWHPGKRNFFVAINSILQTLGNNPSIQVALSLFRSVCLPMLTYGTSSVHLTQAEVHSFSFAYNNIFHKLFKIKQQATIEICQYYSGFWPFQIWYDFYRFSFLASLFKRGLLVKSNAVDLADYQDLTDIANKYNFEMTDSIAVLKFKIWRSLERRLFS